MQQLNLLILTDHRNHSAKNSLYQLAKALWQHPTCGRVAIASRGFSVNDAFFYQYSSKMVYVSEVDNDFTFAGDGAFLKPGPQPVAVKNFDAVLLRMPPPLDPTFSTFLTTTFDDSLWINDPDGIITTGSKQFLLNFPMVCPAMQLVSTIAEIEAFKSTFPIVLKPLHDFGGKGIIRIDGKRVWKGEQEIDWTTFVQELQERPFTYLAMEYLKQVTKGDKRIIVIDGQIIGASLRLPKEGSWLCNASMGGTSYATEPDRDEIKMVAAIHPRLAEMGIVMYGLDTLMGNHGKRVLSEINTTSVGGLAPLAAITDQPILKKAADSICQFITRKQNHYAKSNN